MLTQAQHFFKPSFIDLSQETIPDTVITNKEVHSLFNIFFQNLPVLNQVVILDNFYFNNIGLSMY
jgi:hypothetical protein